MYASIIHVGFELGPYWSKSPCGLGTVLVRVLAFFQYLGYHYSPNVNSLSDDCILA